MPTSIGLISSIRNGDSAADLMRHKDVERGAYGPQQIPLLALAVTHGCVAQMTGLIMANVDLNAASSEGHTALKAALMRGSSQRAELLLQHGARISVPGKRNEIQAATVGGDEDCIDLIISAGQLPDAIAIETALRLRRYRIAESLWRAAGEPAGMLPQIKQSVFDRPDLVATVDGWR